MNTNLTENEIKVLKGVIRSDFLNVDVTTQAVIGKMVPMMSAYNPNDFTNKGEFLRVIDTLKHHNLFVYENWGPNPQLNKCRIGITKLGYDLINEYLTKEYDELTGK
jgi:hypothetical protein